MKIQPTNAVKIGPDDIRVRDLSDARATWNATYDTNGRGSSEAPQCTDCVGRKLYTISYNDRVRVAGTGEEVVLP